jgi:hypothetical protein
MFFVASLSGPFDVPAPQRRRLINGEGEPMTTDVLQIFTYIPPSSLSQFFIDISRNNIFTNYTMAPSTTKQWTVEGKDGFDGLKFNESAKIPEVGDNEVLVKSTSYLSNNHSRHD